jgi:hypothetical protein
MATPAITAIRPASTATFGRSVGDSVGHLGTQMVMVFLIMVTLMEYLVIIHALEEKQHNVMTTVPTIIIPVRRMQMAMQQETSVIIVLIHLTQIKMM